MLYIHKIDGKKGKKIVILAINVMRRVKYNIIIKVKDK